MNTMEASSVPDKRAWDVWSDGPAVSPDFMQDRNQPVQDESVATLESEQEDGKHP